MSGLFSAPDYPDVQRPDPAPPVSERTDSQVQELAAAQRRAFFASGKSSSSTTPGSGTSGGLSAVRFLGGAART